MKAWELGRESQLGMIKYSNTPPERSVDNYPLIVINGYISIRNREIT